jgi:uncharacterized membrane protein YphA (DoxX/SURF4 family)
MVLSGAIVLLFGVYFLAQGHGKMPFHKDPERNSQQMEKVGPMFRLLAPIMIVAGALMVLSGLAS